MDYLKRAKLNIDVMNEAYQEKYKGKIQVTYQEEKVNDVPTFLVVRFEAIVGDRHMEMPIKISIKELDLEKGNIFGSLLLKANHALRDEIILVALGLK